MKCESWKIQISAYLDGALDGIASDAVLRHIESCQECRRFHQDNSALSSLLSDRVEGKTPSPFAWNKIERRITVGENQKSSQSFLDYFRLPRMAYGLASALVLISLATLLQLRGPSDEDIQLLAEMDAYTISAKGNPFLERAILEGDNPFFRFESGLDNPFESNLRTDK